MKIDVLLIHLVVILAVRANTQVRVEDDASVFRSKEPRIRVPHGRVYPQTMNINRADSGGNPIQLRLPPTDGKSNWRTKERIEIEGIPGVLSEITYVNQDPSSDALLNAGIVLVAAAERNRLLLGSTFKHVTGESSGSGGTLNHEIFVDRRLDGVAVSAANYSFGRVHEVRERPARLESAAGCEAVIVIESQSGA